jgi:Cu-Zn family superoxide dismutase
MDAYATLRFTSLHGPGRIVGLVEFTDSAEGLMVETFLHGLKPGLHGLHVHSGRSCGPGKVNGKVVPGGAAKGHLDPHRTQKHLGPYRDGHLGDLPRVTVYSDGTSEELLLAPRVRVRDIIGRALILHAGGDTYADHPKLGGGGARLACGIIQAG